MKPVSRTPFEHNAQSHPSFRPLFHWRLVILSPSPASLGIEAKIRPTVLLPDTGFPDPGAGRFGRG